MNSCSTYKVSFRQMANIIKNSAFACCAVLILPYFASATSITYQLESHPQVHDYNDTPRGWKVNGLFGQGSKYKTTLDFSNALSSMFLTYDDSANTVRIHGTAFGGEASPSAYSATNSGMWEVNFTYATNVFASLDGDLTVTAPSYLNQGTFTPLYDISSPANSNKILWQAGNAINFLAKWDGRTSFTFANNGLLVPGPIDPSLFIGNGWMMATNTSSSAGDWLFSARAGDTQPPNEIPEPLSLSLLAAGLLGSWNRKANLSRKGVI